MAQESERRSAEEVGGDDRRGFMTKLTGIAAGGAVVTGYGGFAAIAGRFVYPAHPTPKSWLYVARVETMNAGDSLEYTAPDGQTIAIARQKEDGDVSDFIALSSTCPHLGCKVHWESQNKRFFCPCHNGVFDAEGKATAGPPADANQQLLRFPLKIENGLLMIEVAVMTQVARAEIAENGGVA